MDDTNNTTNGQLVKNGDPDENDERKKFLQLVDGFPKMLRKSEETLNGWRIGETPFQKDNKAHVQSVIDMEMKDDDVLVLAFPKCGTHWIWEVVKMLQKGEATIEERKKEFVMIEHSEVDYLNQEPSPRILNSHLPMCHLSTQVSQKRIKIIHIVRNPKDTLISYYHFVRPKGTFTLEQFLEKYLANELGSAHQMDYLRQMQQYEKDNPDVPIMTLYYEDMKENPVQITQDLAKHLGLNVTEDFCKDVVEACSFDNMKVKDKERKNPTHGKDNQNMNKMVMPKMIIYRKGLVGDWKNNLTVAQNDLMDAFIQRESQGLKYKFTYNL